MPPLHSTFVMAPNLSIPALPDTRRSTVHELPASGPAHWTLDSVNAAIDAHQQGQFRSPAQLCRTMMLDEAFSAAINKRVNSLLRSKRTIVPHDPNDPVSVRIAEDISSRFEDIFGVMELARFHQWFLLTGVGLATLDWTWGNNSYFPKLRTLNLEHAFYIPYERQWYFTAQHPGQVRVTAGDGRWVKLAEWTQGLPSGFVDSLSLNWYLKQYSKLQWVEFNDTYAYPYLKVYFPESSDPEQDAAFTSMVANARRTKAIGMRTRGDGTKLYDMSVEYAPGGGQQTFKDLIDYADRKYQVAIQGGNLSTEIGATGGNRAAATIHHDVELELVAADAEKLNACMRDQVLQRYVDYAYGPQHKAPNIVWDTALPEDMVQKTQALVNFAEFITAAKQAGITVDNLDAVADKLGLQLGSLSDGSGSPADTQSDGTGTGSGSSDDADADPLSVSDSSVHSSSALADKMSEQGIARCEHGNPNRCRACGIERVRDFELGTDGSPAWSVKWKPIQTST